MKGQVVAKAAAQGCHSMQTRCTCYQATPMPQVCALDIARHPTKCLSRCPCAWTYDGVAAHLAIGVQPMRASARKGSTMRHPTQGCRTCVANACPGCVHGRIPASASHEWPRAVPFDGFTGAPLARLINVHMSSLRRPE